MIYLVLGGIHFMFFLFALLSLCLDICCSIVVILFRCCCCCGLFLVVCCWWLLLVVGWLVLLLWLMYCCLLFCVFVVCFSLFCFLFFFLSFGCPKTPQQKTEKNYNNPCFVVFFALCPWQGFAPRGQQPKTTKQQKVFFIVLFLFFLVVFLYFCVSLFSCYSSFISLILFLSSFGMFFLFHLSSIHLVFFFFFSFSFELQRSRRRKKDNEWKITKRRKIKNNKEDKQEKI